MRLRSIKLMLGYVFFSLDDYFFVVLALYTKDECINLFDATFPLQFQIDPVMIDVLNFLNALQ